MVDFQQQRGFHQLRLDDRRNHGDDGRAGIHDRAFLERVYAAAEVEMSQIIQKFRREHALRAQKVNILRRKMQVFDILHNLLQTGENGKAAAVGILAVKNIKGRLPRAYAILKIAVSHRHFIKIHHHGQVSFPVLLKHALKNPPKKSPRA